MENEVTPRDFGRLEAKVEALEAGITNLQADVKLLLAKYNSSQGVVKFVAGISGAFGAGLVAVGSWVIDHIKL